MTHDPMCWADVEYQEDGICRMCDLIAKVRATERFAVLTEARDAIAAIPSQYSWGMGKWHFICAEDALAAIDALATERQSSNPVGGR